MLYLQYGYEKKQSFISRNPSHDFIFLFKKCIYIAFVRGWDSVNKELRKMTTETLNKNLQFTEVSRLCACLDRRIDNSKQILDLDKYGSLRTHLTFYFENGIGVTIYEVLNKTHESILDDVKMKLHYMGLTLKK